MALSSITALPSTAKTSTNKEAIPGFENVKVKQERPDEAEIRELAAKMVEANKTKMASTRPLVPGTGQNLIQTGQSGIMNYLARAPPQSKVAEKEKKDSSETDKKPAQDEDSVRGRFGWITLGKYHIPYIFRYGEKFCAVRMVELKLLNKYLNYLHSDIYSCTCIRSYYITEAEARLLNEINVRHSESCFGRELFTTKDLVVRLQDACEFYAFLDICYNKLLLSSNNPKDKCGFIRINGESVVPYTVRDGYKYVPLFYFEGETDNLKLKAEKLEGWDLAYLKFCCKVQGIRNELFASETCSVISLGDIKSYFPPGTVFEDYWPSKVVDSQLLLASKSGSNVASAGMWTKQPPAPPPVPSKPVPIAPAVTASLPSRSSPAMPHVSLNAAAAVQAVCNGWPGLVGGQPAFQPGLVAQPSGQVVRMAQAPLSMQNLNSSTNSTSRSYNPVRPRAGHQYYPQVSLSLAPTSSHLSTAQPPPLVRATTTAPSIGSSKNGVIATRAPTYSTPAGLSLTSMSPHLMGLADPSHHQMLPPPSHVTYSQPQQQQQQHSPHYGNSAQQKKYPPPPLVPVNGSSARYPGLYAAGTDVIDLSSPPQSPHRGQQQNAANNRTSSIEQNSAQRKLIQIGEANTSGTHIPYQVQKALVEGKMVPCINAKPFIYCELLMTLPDLVSHFFPSVPLSSCRQVLQDVLGLELFRGNRHQMAILRDAGKCQSTSDVLPLVQLKDVMQFMPQMKYMFSRMNSEESNPAKRQRTS